ncbi:hypothetical protein C6P40_001598 [Pichia californica]|uniref:Uncharacterized protein n=1 Tax=Pichia californica TaxID=460514 RepID=A0A9P6WIX5_9ASCO|nr:hypothetical protein C6P40_001598 [[Candida] californica]
MQFSVVLFAASALAASTITSVDYSTELETITSCGPTVTNCPAKNSTISSASTYTGAADVAYGSYYAAGAAALAAGALLM